MSPSEDDRDPTGRFVRGLTLGALLGAIIAGSSIWTKARARRAAVELPPRVEPDPPMLDVPPTPGADGARPTR